MTRRPCGTNAAYHRHWRHKEPACAACKAAHAAHVRELKRTPCPRTLKFTASDWARAKSMLDDGASYREVSRTIGMAEAYLSEKLPGYGWTKAQCGEWAAFMRRQRSEGALHG